MAGPNCETQDDFPGGYGPEYHDHVTLRDSQFVFKPREGVNIRKEGNSSLFLEVEAGAGLGVVSG